MIPIFTKIAGDTRPSVFMMRASFNHELALNNFGDQETNGRTPTAFAMLSESKCARSDDCTSAHYASMKRVFHYNFFDGLRNQVMKFKKAVLDYEELANP